MNIALIGMSGVGKSRIGKLLSERLNYSLIDIDRIIEKKYGLKLQEIIDNLGDEEFLELEEKTTIEIGEASNAVISLGGSAIYSEKAMNFLKTIATLVFLNASLEEIKQRTPDFSQRGIIGLKEKGLQNLFKQRQPLYRKYADLTIDVKDSDDGVIVELIVEKLSKLSI